MTKPDSWYHEKESAWLYHRVAAAETDPRKRNLFLQLAAAAEEQAAKWEAVAARQAGAAAQATTSEPASRSTPSSPTTNPRTFIPTLRARVVARLLRHFGPRHLRSVLAAMKLRGLSVYSAPSVGHAMPTSVEDFGSRHRAGLGGNLRASVFGMSDGLVSNASLVMGVAGAGAATGYVILTGTAGLLAGALSMAAGEYVSVRSQREMYEYQIALEREEVIEYPEEEAEELALIYQARGIDLEQARKVSRALFANPDQALDVLAREELGLNPDDLGSPLGAATSSFISFALGAAVPLIPFVSTRNAGPTPVLITAIATCVALFLIGMVLSLFTGRDALKGALRMLVIGAGAGVISFVVGRALGVAIGG